MGYIFKLVSGINLETGILIGALIVVTYTVIGGMWAVTITDFFQFALLSLGVLIVLGVCIAQTPDLTLAFSTYIQEFKSILPHNLPNLLVFSFPCSPLWPPQWSPLRA